MTKHVAPLATLVAVVLAAALLALTPGDRPSPAEAVVSGDTDCDSDVDSIDSLFVLRSVAQLGDPAKCIDAGDVNCSDAADSIDALLIQRHIAQLPVNLPKGCPPIGTESAVFLLNEVLYLPPPGEFQYVEIISSGAQTLNDLSLVNQDGQMLTLPDGLGHNAAALTLAMFDGADSVDGPTFHASTTDFLGDPSGSVELRKNGETLDRVAWGEEQPDAVRLSRGGVIGDLEPGASLGRIPGTADTNRDQWVPFSPKQASPLAPNPRPTVEATVPVDGAVIPSGEFELSWYPVEGADSYGLQVSADESFAAPQIDASVTEPSFVVDLADGDYFWRASAVFDGTSQGFGPASLLTVDSAVTRAPGVAAAGQLEFPVIKQRKDTAMLLLESTRETGQHAWDRPHPDLDKTDKADNTNCVLASLAMIANFFGEQLSQDRIGFEVFKNRLPGPERDLNYGDGLFDPQILAAFQFALGVAPEFYRTAGHTADETWAFITTSINGLKPVLAATRYHAVVIKAYYEVQGVRYVKINDPWLGSYNVRLDRSKIERLWRIPGEPNVRADEPSIHTDSDSDGIIDFDETVRFGTSAISADSDRDEYTDKPEVHDSVFSGFGYAYFWQLSTNRDWDDDGKPPELDCDNDNDQMLDGVDSDDYSDPPVRGSPVPCDIDTAIVTLAWDADNDLDLYVLPMPAASAFEAGLQNQEPGYYQNSFGECSLGASQTNRHVVIEVESVDSEYVGVSYWSNCLRPPDGPKGDGPGEADLTVIIQYANGVVEEYVEHVSFTDSWRLFGPLMLPEGPPPPQP